MNSLGFLRNIVQNTITPRLIAPVKISLQQTRTTFILRRRYPVKLYKKGTNYRLFKKKNYIYDQVEDTDVKPKPLLSLILTQYVDGIGDRGQIIKQSPIKAYNNFLLPGLAVYATPENVTKYDAKNVDEYNSDKKSRFLEITLTTLRQFLLNVVMSGENQWTLEKWHVKAAFRKTSIMLNEDCITMPERSITGPNLHLENKEFYVTVTINKTIDVKVRCRIHHWHNDPIKAVPYVPEFYLKPSEPIFPEDKCVLDSLPLPYLMQQATLKESAEI